MGMFLPENISQRITLFIGGKLEFPFIKKEELMGIFFIFGKNNKLYGEEEILAAADLGNRTVAHLTRTVRMFHNSPNKMDSNFTREHYTKRVLQISIELRDNTTNTPFSQSQMNKRIAGDPTILTDCFAQHIACHQQDQFFEIFQPLTENHLPVSLRRKLEGRMLLLGFNVKGSRALPYASTLAAYLMWMKKFNS
ncbi:MAG: hypothetical protein DLM72_06335 [Candidatus Nitrosopolaris wilkensis]|nr:MAG: hypothetical protein DLM72_06335 [Candidatus Nitrosopolaris wilkensis]